MKKLIYALMLLTVACNQAKPYNQPLAHDAACPTICWFGINPGVSTIKDVESILGSTNQITDVTDNPYSGLSVKWQTGNPDYFSSRVEISFGNDIVDSISFSPYPLRLGELIEKIGPPEEISLVQEPSPDGGIFTVYIAYFPSMNSLLRVDSPIEIGPSEDDIIDLLIINIIPEDSSAPYWVTNHQAYRQPWLGFGHLEEYLKNRPMPLE
jgi:hypothetical protein